ncbi:hypothetical protein QWZ16_17960 [Vibrio ostreicida]|uniref:Uncharacterized protein n=1 Tax=Vibrio ostreicida TaxID=526588 RepID=A0ABT8BWC8_9VIBR|nr:hypothetical protein [Vibrio ostreicida]MDN3611486.1 hypothetical protein [Vibrio ostreicida]
MTLSLRPKFKMPCLPSMTQGHCPFAGRLNLEGKKTVTKCLFMPMEYTARNQVIS